MWSFINSSVVAGFVFLASLVAVFYFLQLPVSRAWIFKKKVEELFRWSRENPNLFSNESKPSQLFASLYKLRNKLKGDWPPEWLIERPIVVIQMLRHLEAYPDSKWVISGRALEKILIGEEIPECAQNEITLYLGDRNGVVASPQ